MPPGLGAIIFLTIAIVIVFSVGFFLVHRVMTKPGTHIGSRLPKDGHDGEQRPGAGPKGPKGPGPKDR